MCIITLVLQEVLGVEYEDGNDSPPVSMTSLMWWDILMIGIGCVAASSCPVLLALAVSSREQAMRMRR